MLLSLLIFSVDPCSFQDSFQRGELDARENRAEVSVDSLCSKESAEKRRSAKLAYDLGREQSAVLRSAGIESLPYSHEDFLGLLDIADKKIKMRALKDEVQNRDLRIQEMQRNVQTNSQLAK